MNNGLKINWTFTAISLFFLFFVSCNSTNTKLNVDSPPEILQKFSGNENYSIFYPETIDPEQIYIDSLFIQVAYKFTNDRLLLIGKSQLNDPKGLKLLLIDSGNKNRLLYRSKGAYESLTMHPTFFKSNNINSPIVILCAHGLSESWGQEIFILKGDTVNEIGFLEVTGKEPADMAYYESGYKLTDIGPQTDVFIKNRNLNFRFITDSVFYLGVIGEDYDITLPANKIEYRYDGDSLMLVLK